MFAGGWDHVQNIWRGTRHGCGPPLRRFIKALSGEKAAVGARLLCGVFSFFVVF